MNTHDIELPPLPEPAWVDGEPYWYDRHMESYARAAIEADRKRRSEPVGEAVIDICEHGHKFAKLTDHPVNNQGHPSCVHCLRIGLAKARAAQPAASVEPVAWLYEDELPDNYPYDTMFPYSKVDGVRMFPVYALQPAEPMKHPSYGPDCCQGHKAESDCKCAAYDAEPVKVPSDGEIESLAKEHMFAHAQFVGAGEVWYEGEVEFARDLLAKYGQGQTRMDTGFEGENTTVSGQGSGHAKPIATVITHNNHKLLSFDPGALDELPDGTILYAKK